jgi:acyl-CoA thioester hydrolase
MVGLSPQGIRWKIRHDFLKANGKKSVIVLLEGTFLDLATRKPTVLPAPILEVFQLVPRTPDFEVLSDRRWFSD